MAEYYKLSALMVQFFGPVMAVCLVMMYVFLIVTTGNRPRLREVIYSYVRYNLQRKKHAGLLTYMLIISFFFFLVSVIGVVIGHITKI